MTTEKLTKERKLTKAERAALSAEKAELAKVRTPYLEAYRDINSPSDKIIWKFFKGRAINSPEQERAYLEKFSGTPKGKKLAEAKAQYEDGKKRFRALLDKLYDGQQEVADFYYAEEVFEELKLKKRYVLTQRVFTMLGTKMKAGIEQAQRDLKESWFTRVLLGVFLVEVAAVVVAWLAVNTVTEGGRRLIIAILSGVGAGFAARGVLGWKLNRNTRKKVKEKGRGSRLSEEEVYERAEDLRQRRDNNRYASMVLAAVTGAMVRFGVIERMAESFGVDLVDIRDRIFSAFNKAVTAATGGVSEAAHAFGDVLMPSEASAADFGLTETIQQVDSSLGGFKRTFGDLTNSYKGVMRNQLDSLAKSGAYTEKIFNLDSDYAMKLGDMGNKISYLESVNGFLKVLARAEDYLTKVGPEEYARTRLKYGFPPLQDLPRLKAENITLAKNLMREISGLERELKGIQSIVADAYQRNNTRVAGKPQPGKPLSVSSEATSGTEASSAGRIFEAPELGKGALTPDTIIDAENMQAVLDAIRLREMTKLEKNIEELLHFIRDFRSLKPSEENAKAFAKWFTHYSELIGKMKGLAEIRGKYSAVINDIVTASKNGTMTVDDVMERLNAPVPDGANTSADAAIMDTTETMNHIRREYPDAMLGSAILASYDGPQGGAEELLYRPNETGPADVLTVDEYKIARADAYAAYEKARDAIYEKYPKGIKKLIASLQGIPNGRGTADAILATQDAINRRIAVYQRAIDDSLRPEWLKSMRKTTINAASADALQYVEDMKNDPSIQNLLKRLKMLTAEGEAMRDNFLNDGRSMTLSSAAFRLSERVANRHA